jgi:phosphate transport system protein
VEDDGPPYELRRDYHDLIASLREETLSMLGQAVEAAASVTAALVEQNEEAGRRLAVELGRVGPNAATVEGEVLALLALQAPVARDLRIILAARDVAQTTALCVGLCQTLATRVACAPGVMSAELSDLLERGGACSAALLRDAQGAWASLDEEQAQRVLAHADACRAGEQELFAALLRLRDVPVETGLNLGLTARVFGRLTDHAQEIAERVLFVASGPSPSFSRTGL